MSLKCVKIEDTSNSEVASSSINVTVIVKREINSENEEDLVENSDNIKVPEFVNIKEEPNFSQFE